MNQAGLVIKKYMEFFCVVIFLAYLFPSIIAFFGGVVFGAIFNKDLKEFYHKKMSSKIEEEEIKNVNDFPQQNIPMMYPNTQFENTPVGPIDNVIPMYTTTNQI